MTDQAVDDYLEAEKLYEPLLKVLLSLDPADMTYSSREEAWVLLDRILTMGKIIGRRTAIPHGITDPAPGQVWRLKTNTDLKVKVASFSPSGIVLYRHIDCACTLVGHTLTEHEGRSLLRMFKEQYEPVEEYDDLIEGWLKAVRGGL